MPKKSQQRREKKPDLSPVKRSEVITLYREGKSESQITAITKQAKSTVHSTIVRWKQTGSLESKKRSGRPTKVTPQVQKKIDCYLKKHDEAVPKEIVKDLNLDLSTRTVK